MITAKPYKVKELQILIIHIEILFGVFGFVGVKQSFWLCPLGIFQQSVLQQNIMCHKYAFCSFMCYCTPCIVGG